MKVTIEVEQPQVPAATLHRLALRKMARKWRAEGYTFQQIAKACRRSLRTVWLWCNDVPRGTLQ